MYLEKIEIQGFKSFAQKTIMEFPVRGKDSNPGIAAIVGPNGSGKSNTADAMRWVLGEQSIKLLRGKKADDVIFSGSGKKARLGFAEVSIFLNNKDKTGGIDYEQIVIKRRVYRNGEGEYYINNSKARLSDIQLLLAQANFGQRTYSVIGQGMVDTILSSTAHERKNFFDEATGVKQYQIKRDQAVDKIQKTEENLSQVSVVLKEITPRLKSLERQMEKLKKREDLEKELKDLQLNYYGAAWSKITKELEDAKDKKRKISETHLFLTKKLAELSQKMEKMEKESKDNSSEEYEKTQKEYFSAMNKKNELSYSLSALSRELELIESSKKIKKVDIDFKKLAQTAKENEKFLDSFLKSETFEDFSNLKKKAKDLKDEISGIFSQENGKKEDLTEKINPIKEKIKSIREELEKASQVSMEKERALELSRKNQTKATAFLFETQKTYQEIHKELNEVASEKNKIDVDCARLETRKDDIEQEVEKETKQDLIIKIKSYSTQNNSFDTQKYNWNNIARVKTELETIGGIDSSIGEEYEETKKRHDFLYSQTKDLEEALDKTKKVLKNLDQVIDTEFNKSFEEIKKGFSEYFNHIFNGGKATLEINKQNELEALSEEVAESLTKKEQEILSEKHKIGIEISACPPGKKVNSINMLSGGEKALTSIALICAIIKANPSPFVVLDEVDAALDEANSERFAEILEKLSKHTQFIAITHNRATMEKANILYGVTMNEEGVTKLLSVDLEKAMKDIQK